MRRGVIRTDGANCPSCAFTIEHLGRKVRGVADVKVDSSLLAIHVEYEGNPASLERVAEIVRRLGYSADIQRE